tara:strand:+ start:206 stop:460 length:255 start_codon:yes stop_codon:yes gene_type:complete
MILKRTMYNNTIKSIKIDEKTIDAMADHLVGKKLSVYREGILDADGDKKLTLTDFIHRIKNIKGEETRDKIPTAADTTTTGGGY